MTSSSEHRALAVGRAVERDVVDDYELSICRWLNIELDRMRAELHGAGECRHRVLGRSERGSSMGDDLHDLHLTTELRSDAKRSLLPGLRRASDRRLDFYQCGFDVTGHAVDAM